MRAYFFGNMYLSSIQQGIQAAHVVAEMFCRYNKSSNILATNMLHDWARYHKTMILLNAGYSTSIRSLIDMFESADNPYPWAFFREGDDALDGALTCIGIILPEFLYEAASQLRQNPRATRASRVELVPGLDYFSDLTEWEWTLINKLNEFGLAR